MEHYEEHTWQAITPDEWLQMIETLDREALVGVLKHQKPADIAVLLQAFSSDFQKHIIDLLDDQTIAEALVEIEPPLQQELLKLLPSRTVGFIIKHVASDDAADILGEFEEDQIKFFLRMLPNKKRHQISSLLDYDEESAGGIMSAETLTVGDDTTVEDVIREIRTTAEDFDDLYNVYVVDKDFRLCGALSLQELIIAQPDQNITEIMNRDIIKVDVELDQEEVAAIFMRYDLVSAPVVDSENHLLGRITHDDIIDVFADEVDEDFARLSGQSEIEPAERSIYRNLRSRLPWLLLGLAGGLIAAGTIAGFEGQLTRYTSLVFFLPLVAAMGGNAGIQTSSVMVRGIATGEILDYGIWSRLLRELVVSLTTGFICGLVVLIVCFFWFNDLKLGLAVSTSLWFVIAFAAIVGASIPLVLKRYGIDPAMATGPFITTTNDILGLFVYLAVASFIFSF